MNNCTHRCVVVFSGVVCIHSCSVVYHADSFYDGVEQSFDGTGCVASWFGSVQREYECDGECFALQPGLVLCFVACRFCHCYDVWNGGRGGGEGRGMHDVM